MAGAKKLSKTHPLSLRVPQQTYDYLMLLARRGKLAATVPEVAARILEDETERLFARGYHDQNVPPA